MATIVNEFTLNFSATDPGSTGESENFTQSLGSQPLILTENHKVGLRLSSITNSYDTISVAIGNNTFEYTGGIVDPQLVTIPDGNYTVQELNDFVFNFMVSAGDAAVVPGPISFNSITPQGKVELVITGGFTLDFTQPVISNFFDLVGFLKTDIIAATTIATNRANMGNDVTNFLVGTNIAQGLFLNNRNSNILAHVPITGPPSSTMVYIPNQIIFIPTIVGVLTSVNIFITDNLNRGAPLFSLNGEPVSVELILREFRVVGTA